MSKKNAQPIKRAWAKWPLWVKIIVAMVVASVFIPGVFGFLAFIIFLVGMIFTGGPPLPQPT